MNSPFLGSFFKLHTDMEEWYRMAQQSDNEPWCYRYARNLSGNAALMANLSGSEHTARIYRSCAARWARIARRHKETTRWS